MEHFTKRLNTSKGSLGFYFNRFFAPDGIRWQVSVVSPDRKAYSAQMVFDSTRRDWVFKGYAEVPKWFLGLEMEFSSVILENEEAE